MGRHLRLEARGSDTFYVPTCNLLVRRSVYQALGGLREDLRMGEDVDFCWRLRCPGTLSGLRAGRHRAAQAPQQLWLPMLRRRAGYGSSEARLYALHPDKRKRFPWEPAPLATVALLSAAVIGRRPRLLAACSGAGPLGRCAPHPAPLRKRCRPTGAACAALRGARASLDALLRVLPSGAVLPGAAGRGRSPLRGSATVRRAGGYVRGNRRLRDQATSARLSQLLGLLRWPSTPPTRPESSRAASERGPFARIWWLSSEAPLRRYGLSNAGTRRFAPLVSRVQDQFRWMVRTLCPGMSSPSWCTASYAASKQPAERAVTRKIKKTREKT